MGNVCKWHEIQAQTQFLQFVCAWNSVVIWLALFVNTDWILLSSLLVLSLVFRNGYSGFVKNSQSSSLDVGCTLFCFLSRWSQTASNMLSPKLSSINDWQCFYIQIWFYCMGSVFRITVMFLKEPAGSQLLSRWYFMVENLTVAFCVHNAINANKIFNTTGWNSVPNHELPLCFIMTVMSILTVTSLLASFIHSDEYLNQTFKIWFITPWDLLPLILVQFLCNLAYFNFIPLQLYHSVFDFSSLDNWSVCF